MNLIEPPALPRDTNLPYVPKQRPSIGKQQKQRKLLVSRCANGASLTHLPRDP